MTARYVELQVTSNFSFLRGASHPEELVATAAAFDHAAAAITDRNSLAGAVRAWRAARETGIQLLVGARLDLVDGASLLCFPMDRAAYGRLCRLLTLGKRRAPKGECHIGREDALAYGEGQIMIVLPPADRDVPSGSLALGPESPFALELAFWRGELGDRCYLAASHLYRGDDARRLATLDELATHCRTPLVATNDVHAHAPERRPLQDVLTCIREGCTLDGAGVRLFANAERHLKPAAEMIRLFARYPAAVARTAEIADRLDFDLSALRYEYPDEATAPGRTPQAELTHRTRAGAHERYGGRVPQRVQGLLEHELDLIGQLGYAPYFLTVHDIVRFARGRGILCQGRGSAANSAVCYCLGITAVDPSRLDLLFERFVSAERGEPPDIDVDFEHERREEVIQYIYQKYGRDRAGIAATVISYRARSAIREVGKALGLSLDTVGALAGTVWGWSSEGVRADYVREIGLDPSDRTLGLALKLAREIIGFPRHLSQHVGGFVITRGPLSEVVPIGNAAMEDRTAIEWDKDDLDALGILKIDVLGLGMLTCLRKGFELLEHQYGRKLDLAIVPAEDPVVYDMLCKADSIGVFQVESRAQMSFLPRMKPRDFYDLVIEVAIVRPGPIQGDMVHPYLRRRNGEEKVAFPSKELKEVLGKTLGVPLFQEQAMRIAIVAAGFTPSESDALRRAMATFRKTGQIHKFHDKMIEGMVARGYERDFATRCFQQIEGFGEYGFPESHAASFALLVYVSAWLKCRYPAAFACALLNSQPMGFYAPAQIVRDARDHGVEVRPVDVNISDWDCTLERVETVPVDDADARPSPFLPARSRSFASAKAGETRDKLAPQGEGRKDDPPAPTRPPHPEEGPEVLSRRIGFTAPDDVIVSEDEAQSGEIASVAPGPCFALRLGFRQIKGLAEEHARRLVETRGPGYASPRDLWRRAGLASPALERLAQADAFGSMGLDRRAALWAIKGLGPEPLPLFAAAEARDDSPAPDRPESREPAVTLPAMPLGEQVANDYTSLRLSLKAHPLAFLRAALDRERVVPSDRLRDITPGRRITIAGLVLVRQRPGSAKGVIFATLEDETGYANVIIWPPVFERFRRVVLGATLLAVTGRLQREGIVIHVVAERLTDLSHRLADLDADTPLAPTLARADEVKHREPDPLPPNAPTHAAGPSRADYPSRNFH